MPQLIGGFIALVLIIYAIATLFVSIPVWGINLIIMYAGASIIASSHVAGILRSMDAISIKLNSNKINYNIHEGDITKYASAYPSMLLPIILSVGWSVLIMNEFKPSPFSDDIILWYVGHAIWAIILIIVAVHTSFLVPEWVIKRIKKKLDTKITYIECNIEELIKIQNDINQLSNEINIIFENHLLLLEEDVRKHIYDLIKNAKDIDNIISSKIIEAKKDYEHLKEMSAYYYGIIKKYKHVSREVNRTGSRSLISEMDDLHLYVTSNNLLTFLSRKEWDKFKNLLLPIEQHLDELAEVAEGYKTEAAHEKPIEISDEAKALEILGLEQSASVSDIKKAYKKLAKEFHPDKAEQTTQSIRRMAEKRFQDINWAKDILLDSKRNRS